MDGRIEEGGVSGAQEVEAASDTGEEAGTRWGSSSSFRWRMLGPGRGTPAGRTAAGAIAAGPEIYSGPGWMGGAEWRAPKRAREPGGRRRCRHGQRHREDQREAADGAPDTMVQEEERRSQDSSHDGGWRVGPPTADAMGLQREGGKER